jgi:hypothetical protein
MKNVSPVEWEIAPASCFLNDLWASTRTIGNVLVSLDGVIVYELH